MNRTWFVISTILGIAVFYMMHGMDVKYAAVYISWYFLVIALVRRRYLKYPRWHFWNPLNLFDYFKKP